MVRRSRSPQSRNDFRRRRPISYRQSRLPLMSPKKSFITCRNTPKTFPLCRMNARPFVCIPTARLLPTFLVTPVELRPRLSRHSSRALILTESRSPINQIPSLDWPVLSRPMKGNSEAPQASNLCKSIPRIGLSAPSRISLRSRATTFSSTSISMFRCEPSRLSSIVSMCCVEPLRRTERNEQLRPVPSLCSTRETGESWRWLRPPDMTRKSSQTG